MELQVKKNDAKKRSKIKDGKIKDCAKVNKKGTKKGAKDTLTKRAPCKTCRNVKIQLSVQN